MEMPVDWVGLTILLGMFVIAIGLIVYVRITEIRDDARIAEETERREREAKKDIQKQIRGE